MNDATLDVFNQHIVYLERTLASTADSLYQTYLSLKGDSPSAAGLILDEYNKLVEKKQTLNLLSTSRYQIIDKEINSLMLSGIATTVLRWYRNTRFATVQEFRAFWETISNEPINANIEFVLKPFTIPNTEITPSAVATIVFILVNESVGVTLNVK